MSGDRDAIALAERVLAVLAEGSFSATYKFALFLAILDLCLEKATAHGIPPEAVTTRQLAEKVLELYWNQVLPYGRRGILRQGGKSAGGQAEILRHIEAFRARWAGSQADTLHRARLDHPREFKRLLNCVEWKLIEMPIPRLQKLGQGEGCFLYEYRWTEQIRQSTVTAYQRGMPSMFDNALRLLPGVGENLVLLNGVLRPLFHREWAVKVADMNRLPEAELERFLFGSERSPLSVVRAPLIDLQNKRCFYCKERLNACAQVDHFIPWSRYADDGIDNLVVSDPRCNNSKRDFLAAHEHLEHWIERAKSADGRLADIARGVRWRRDADRTLGVARTIYLRLPVGARLWLRGSEFVPVDGGRLDRTFSPPPSG
jgi:hypothetical protein